MANDARQFERSMQQWDHLHAQNAYSLPRELGFTAILCSYVSVEGSSDSLKIACVSPSKDVPIFRKEALAIADILHQRNRAIEVVLNANTGDFNDVLQDPTVSDVVTIGHGSLSDIFIKSSDNTCVDVIDWTAVSKAADHLKQGSFVQRHCGKRGRRLSVPYGAFALSDHRKVLAPVGQYFAPRGLRHPHNRILQQVSNTERLVYQDVLSHFPVP